MRAHALPPPLDPVLLSRTQLAQDEQQLDAAAAAPAPTEEAPQEEEEQQEQEQEQHEQPPHEHLDEQDTAPDSSWRAWFSQQWRVARGKAEDAWERATPTLEYAEKVIDQATAEAQRKVKSIVSDDSYDTTEQRISAAVRELCVLNAGAGFATSMIPVAGIPMTLMTSLYLQYKLVATIAGIRGYDIEDERVKPLLLGVLGGDVATELGRNVVASWTVRAGNHMAARALKTQLLQSMLSRAGERAVGSVVARSIPVIGSLFSAAIDGGACYALGKSVQSHVLGPAQLDDPVHKWSRQDVSLWLSNIDMPQYADVFHTERITGLTLLDMTQDDLRQSLGMRFGDAKRLVRELELAKERWSQNERKKQQRQATAKATATPTHSEL